MEDNGWPSPVVNYPAGWYPLPDGSQERFWDGAQWTAAYRPRLSPNAQGLSASATYGALPLNHGPAIASMVLGILSLVVLYAGIITGILGLVFGITSLKHVQPRGPKRGRGMAIAGIVCSTIALVCWTIILVAFVLARRQANL